MCFLCRNSKVVSEDQKENASLRPRASGTSTGVGGRESGIGRVRKDFSEVGERVGGRPWSEMGHSVGAPGQRCEAPWRNHGDF